MEFKEAKFLLSCVAPDDFPKPVLKEVVFSGRSNVGKSSLINKLLRKKLLARISSKPGKTVSVNFYKVGESMHFVDLPGYGYARVSLSQKKEISRVAESYFQSPRKFAVVVQIIDIRRLPTRDDFWMLEFLLKKSIPFIIALSKKDKLKKSRYLERLEEIKEELLRFKNAPQVPFSSLTGDGIFALKKTIAEFL
ncbi:MAG: ribosome biogenesis GTP-binding protein YihA/YsxC [Oscillospiraceae bacterium]|nr:ribosome biogenesis GTP-binding protein YihA/YsxC [Oscillospiraceae bacterium]